MTAIRPGRPRTGITLAFGCLLLLGLMPVITNGRPAGASALSFALCLTGWQLLCSVPLQVREWRSGERGVFRDGVSRDGVFRVRGCLVGPAVARPRHVLVVTLVTGLLFACSTWAYVLAFDRAGAVDAAIALQAYPLCAAALEALVLGRSASRAELAWTCLIVVALYHLATHGTWRMAGLSAWFAVALAVPALWSIAHVLLRQVLVTTPITPNQVTTSRLLVSLVCLFPLALAVDGPTALVRAAVSPGMQLSAAIMGLAYYVELVLWFHAVRHVEVSVASTITVPAPAVTMLLAVGLLGEPVRPFQLAALAVVVVGLIGMLHAGSLRQGSRQRAGSRR